MSKVNDTPAVLQSPLTACPGCGSMPLGERLFLPQLPVILNYRFATKEAAQNVALRDLELRECNHCGLVFNAILDAASIPYDELYENRQNFSSGFLTMLQQTADGLSKRYKLEGGTVLEVGCGKGDFLQLLCDRSKAQGLGYDTSCEKTGPSAGGRVCFFQRYVTPVDVKTKVDLVVCRHVVEHVPEIGEFFCLLHDIAIAGGSSAVYIETPTLEWIVDHAAFWDVFYEHCNYFTMHTLRKLAEKAGFAILDQRLIFGDQYQALELRPNSKANSPPPSRCNNNGRMLRRLADCLANSRENVTARLEKAGAQNGWAVWGAGAKGVSLTHAMSDHPPKFVIDSNPAKQGMFLPGTGIPVVAPDDPKVSSIPVIIVANANYLPEIHSTLAQRNCTAQLLPL